MICKLSAVECGWDTMPRQGLPPLPWPFKAQMALLGLAPKTERGVAVPRGHGTQHHGQKERVIDGMIPQTA